MNFQEWELIEVENYVIECITFVVVSFHLKQQFNFNE